MPFSGVDGTKLMFGALTCTLLGAKEAVHDPGLRLVVLGESDFVEVTANATLPDGTEVQVATYENGVLSIPEALDRKGT